ncbi:unnamed protein product [Xylocopa violacea]|uniref:Uncharacterized protein n=1 Tax=Xylocopa violacea TaxID=135666 RepID=A0ABP1P659_XYLVO
MLTKSVVLGTGPQTTVDVYGGASLFRGTEQVKRKNVVSTYNICLYLEFVRQMWTRFSESDPTLHSDYEILVKEVILLPGSEYKEKKRRYDVFEVREHVSCVYVHGKLVILMARVECNVFSVEMTLHLADYVVGTWLFGMQTYVCVKYSQYNRGAPNGDL